MLYPLMPNGGSREAETISTMKNHLHNSLRGLFLSLAVLLSLPMLAEEIMIDGLRYELFTKTKQATVIRKIVQDYSGKIIIPASVEYDGTNYSVTSIGSDAFSACSSLTSVNIPNSVTSIGAGAFYGCSGLASVTIPNSVTSIGEDAFEKCSSLTSVTIGKGVRNIGEDAFAHCSVLQSITIPNSVESIERATFWGCSGLTSVTIGNGVKSIRDYAFNHCYALTSLTIGNSVLDIGRDAFYDCTKLLDVYCYAETAPYTTGTTFTNSSITDAILHVPDASIESYREASWWGLFGKIIALSGEEPEQAEVKKCAVPVVTYTNGRLKFLCETEGAEFVTNITADDIKRHYNVEIELCSTYNIEVYAIKSGYDNSDIVCVALVWVENGDVNEETGVISVEAAPVLVQGNGGVLNVSGVAKGTDVVVYTISGTKVASATATDGTATISTGLQSGTIVVVKFGNKSVKVRI